ncbi:hypothetical protein [Pseudanabaena galeata]|nr:hypothetical protein [Pseudanabaena galeata]MEA5487141.1 hypothetical protein [Pseudanabaena sp. CCNP1317]WGS74970.1 hypothetical protein OA858_24625 [Pseudanabaena galeata CCNP1313]
MHFTIHTFLEVRSRCLSVLNREILIVTDGNIFKWCQEHWHNF